jgi:hypothetical protein
MVSNSAENREVYQFSRSIGLSIFPVHFGNINANALPLDEQFFDDPT